MSRKPLGPVGAPTEDYQVLTPSERVNVIAEIARRLGRNEWPLIDLTLRQFSLPWANDWQGTEPVQLRDGDDPER